MINEICKLFNSYLVDSAWDFIPLLKGHSMQIEFLLFLREATRRNYRALRHFQFCLALDHALGILLE